MQKILILDFGGQYNQLIARRVRECRVYCEVKPYTMTMAEIRAFAPMGIIFTGGPNSVYLEESPQVDPEIFSGGRTLPPRGRQRAPTPARSKASAAFPGAHGPRWVKKVCFFVAETWELWYHKIVYGPVGL